MKQLLGKFVKVVFSDGDKNKAVKGILESVNGLYICVRQGNGPAYVAIKNIVSLMPFEEGGNG